MDLPLDNFLTDAKKRILVISEFSELNTGFSVMTKELLKLLYASNKYVVAELASYISEDEPKIHSLPWKVYPAQPGKNNPKLEEFYKTYNEAQFGSLALSDALLDFKPDICISWRDFWHDYFICKSPMRHMYKYIWSVCVDSEPPQQDWLDVYSTVDQITSYTQWGLNVLKKYTGNKAGKNISNIDTMPGVDLNTFKPQDKALVREKYNLKNDSNLRILTTVARNQPRKLFPELLRAFKESLNILNKTDKEKANGAFLHLHTSVNDVGWNIIEEIKNYNLSHKILLTYKCRKCEYLFISYARGEHCHCPNCGALSCVTPNTVFGASREELADIYNLADGYIQLQIAGALEIPLIEAKSCGLPTIAVSYAAPYEIQQMIGSYGNIDVIYYRQESIRETGQHRGYPKFESIVENITNFFLEDKNVLIDLGKESRIAAESLLDYKITAEKWMSLIDNMEILPRERWFDKPKIIQISKESIPWHLPEQQFVRWCCQTMLPDSHEKQRFLFEKELLKNLSLGYVPVSAQEIRPFTKMDVYNDLIKEINYYNHYEMHRYNTLIIKPKENKTHIKYQIYT